MTDNSAREYSEKETRTEYRLLTGHLVLLVDFDSQFIISLIKIYLQKVVRVMDAR